VQTAKLLFLLLVWLAVCFPAVWFRLYCHHNSILFCSDSHQLSHRSILFIEWCPWLCLLTCNSFDWTQCCYPGKDNLIDWMWELLLCCSHPFCLQVALTSCHTLSFFRLHCCISHKPFSLAFPHGVFGMWMAACVLCHHVQLKWNRESKSTKVLCVRCNGAGERRKGVWEERSASRSDVSRTGGIPQRANSSRDFWTVYSVLKLNVFRMCLHCKHVLNMF